MPTKKHAKKTTRQKRLIHTMATNQSQSAGLSNSEDAIIRQFRLIQKGYSKLITDVAKELNLVKQWVEVQATSRREELKAKINSRIDKY